MRQYTVTKGVGRSPELFGISEKFIVYLGGALIPAVVSFALARVVLGSLLLGAVFFAAIVLAAYVACRWIYARHGEDGLAKMRAYSRRPRMLRSDSRRVFLDLHPSPRKRKPS